MEEYKSNSHKSKEEKTEKKVEKIISGTVKSKKKNEIYPKFIIKKSSDLMIRGGDFYAVWIEEKGLWSTDEQDALQLIDNALDKYAEENKARFDSNIKVLHMWDSESGMIDSWHKYCQRQMRDSFQMLDEKLIFSNTATGKADYASKRLNYPLEKGDITAYDKLMSTLYSEEERRKIEWAIGSIVTGDSKKIQKFMVLYGAVGTGKSTVLNIIQKLFEGYYSVFDAKSLGSSSNSFALEAFKSNPLVAIQHDGDLSRIEDNTRLNSLVSHELMTVNEKFKSAYSNRFKCFLFMGTNKPVKITDAKSGLIRRLIDVSPSGNKLNPEEYKSIIKQVDFELGAIAYHCRQMYLDNINFYDNYIPIAMLGASNDFYNFITDSYYVFKEEDGTTLKAAWEMYKTYCDEAKVAYPMSLRPFKEELKNYFRDYKERLDGKFIGNAPLNKFDISKQLATQAAVLGTFSAMSVVSGQYFLAQINSELDRIKLGMDKILEFLYGDKKAELMSEVNFAKYAFQNYSSIMANESQKIATITSLQKARQIAMKDCEFYISDLESTVRKSSDIISTVNKAIQIKESLDLALQLCVMSSVMEVYYSQNFDDNYLKYIENDISLYIDKCEKNVLGNFNQLLVLVLNAKTGILKKVDKDKLERKVAKVIEQVSMSGESELKKSLRSGLYLSTNHSTYYLSNDGNVYIKTD